MKTLSLFVLGILLSYQQSYAQDKLCSSLQKMITGATSQFKNLKGDLESDDGDVKYYALKEIPEGWSYGNYIVDGKNIFLAITAGTDETEEAGLKRFRSLSKELAACLSATGKEDKDSFENPEMIFVSKGTRFKLKLLAMDGKYLTDMQVEKSK